MKITYGDYTIKTHELDNKLTVQVFSDLGEVNMGADGTDAHDFPNGVSFYIKDCSNKPQAKGLKRFAFGEYTFILGINKVGELVLFHSVNLGIGKKVIDGKDTLNLAFLKDPKSL